MFTKSYKVFGRTGHRQRLSFSPSRVNDYSEPGNVRIVELVNSDKTGTNDYTIIKITRNSESECDRELQGQLSDGVFENIYTGDVVPISEG